MQVVDQVSKVFNVSYVAKLLIVDTESSKVCSTVLEAAPQNTTPDRNPTGGLNQCLWMESSGPLWNFLLDVPFQFYQCQRRSSMITSCSIYE